MGITDALRGRNIYLDTNVFIYALEGYPAYSSFGGLRHEPGIAHH